MRNSKILAKLRDGQPIKFGMLGHFVPAYIAYAADLGFDGIWLELEHRPMDAREVQALLAYFHLYDIDCIVRPPTREKTQLYRYLEDGATGLVIPHINSLDEVHDLVSKTKFPPVGDRGLEGRGLESNFGVDTGADRQKLVDHASQETLLMIQIETPAALAIVDDIAAVPGVDALFVGPADLALRMQHLPEDQQVSREESMRLVAAACEKHGKAWGSMPASVDHVREFLQLGATIIPWQNDQSLLQLGLLQRSTELDALFAEVL